MCSAADFSECRKNKFDRSDSRGVKNLFENWKNVSDFSAQLSMCACEQHHESDRKFLQIHPKQLNFSLKVWNFDARRARARSMRSVIRHNKTFWGENLNLKLRAEHKTRWAEKLRLRLCACEQHKMSKKNLMLKLHHVDWEKGARTRHASSPAIASMHHEMHPRFTVEKSMDKFTWKFQLAPARSHIEREVHFKNAKIYIYYSSSSLIRTFNMKKKKRRRAAAR